MCAGEAGHRKAIGERRGRVFGFEWLAASGGEEDAVESEGVCGGGGDGEMALVGWVEGAAEEGDAHDAV